MNFDEFLGLVSVAEKLPLRPRREDFDRYGLEEPREFPRFVPPTLRQLTTPRSSPAVVLISAPGALGKTTLARELARRVGSPLWNLGKVNVGHEFLTGAIVRAFGDEEFPRVKRELLSGQRTLVFDGLDEARLRAGDENFEAFLESLGADFRTPGARPSLVLLGRAEAVSDTALWLDELLGVANARYEIEYFERAAAQDFVRKYLSIRSNNRPHEQNPTAFNQALDIVLDRLREAVPEGVDRRSLAGYAPVLELVSELLDVRNPWAEYQQILREVERWRSATLVRQIATSLLDREHTKTAQLAAESRGGGAAAFDWTMAYRPDEQCLRLLSSRAGLVLEQPLPLECQVRTRCLHFETPTES